MNAVEDRARAAMRALADTVDDAPPLPIADRSRARGGWLSAGLTLPRWGRSHGTRRLGGWLGPLAAAAAVLAVAVSLVIVRSIEGGDDQLVMGPVPVVSGVPRYYVALDVPGGGSGNLVIGDTFTGKRLAVVQSPTSVGFSGITAAADDRTFVVDTSSGGGANPATPRTWYLLRLKPGATPGYQLTRLPVPVLENVAVESVALSGSGAELALALDVGKVGPDGTMEIRIYSVATGQLLRSWSTPAAAAPEQQIFGEGGMFGEQNRGLTWVDGDRALVFPVIWISRNQVIATNQEFMVMRRLDISSGGGDLMGTSQVIWTSKSSVLSNYPPGCEWGFNPLISADGKTIICVSVSGPPFKRGANQQELVTWKFSWQAYSVAAPTVARDIFRFTVKAPRSGPGDIREMWTDTSGDTALVWWTLLTGAAKGLHFGSISGGSFRPLPVPPGLDVSGGLPSVTW
jgi:hypothetical protein